MFVTVDRAGGLPVDADFEPTHRAPRRPLPHGRPRHWSSTTRCYVSLEIDLLVCVQPSYFRSRRARAACAEVLGNRDAARRPARPVPPRQPVSFGQTVYLSPLYAAARQVAGVASVQVTRFQRQGTGDPLPLSRRASCRSARLEIARLDNDPNFPEHGVLRLTLFGGK